MLLHTIRISTTDFSSLGAMYIDGSFACWTLEDTKRAFEKIDGETRIPDGLYEIKLRAEGGMNARYSAKFPFHRGMLHLQNVPRFSWVYIHYGNKRAHTQGCILVGDGLNNNVVADGFSGSSVKAYSRIYPLVADELLAGGRVKIRISNLG